MSRTIMRVTEPEKSKTLTKWQERLEVARQSYQHDLTRMGEFEKRYDGSREVAGNPNSSRPSTKLASQVRNITHELIESQVDSSIPMPKVTPIHEEDLKKARSIEHFLSNFVRQHKFDLINDEQERTTPIQGGDFLHVEWDSTKGTHCVLGDVEVSELHPRQVIPQPGCVDIDKMDYVFVQIAQTKEFVKRKYGVDVENAGEENPDIRNNSEASSVTDIVTVNIAYYRNKNNGIGRFVWCDDYVLSEMDDYQARKQEVCSKCGLPKGDNDVCICGSKSFKKVNKETETLLEEVVINDGETVIPPGTEVPYYTPNVIPLILRKNVSKNGKMLGKSDVDAIKDQQDTINKLGSKRNEKVMKAGSLVTMPYNLKVETSDEELKIVRVRDAHEKALIEAINLQVDPSIDRVVMNDEYDFARSTLGITDSFQGKYDPSATSGTAKQYSINQAAGRLESKRVLKNYAYARLYEMIFKFMLAYSDQKVPFSYQMSDGEYSFEHFDRFDFLKIDDAGKFYWNDEFIFETDPTSTMLMNREAMWQQADLKLQSGAFGMLGEPEAMYRYWAFLEKNNYPYASEVRRMFEEKVQEQKMMQQMASQMGMAAPQEGFAPEENSALIPDEYVESDVEHTLNDMPMQSNANIDPYLAQALVGKLGGQL